MWNMTWVIRLILHDKAMENCPRQSKVLWRFYGSIHRKILEYRLAGRCMRQRQPGVWAIWFKGNTNKVQYLEQKILEFCQLTPTITERLLVRKLANHFGWSTQIAVVTRRVNNVCMLTHLLIEFEHIDRKKDAVCGTPKWSQTDNR